MILRISSILLTVLALFLAACSDQPGEQTAENKLAEGQWRAVLKSPGGELPFGLEITKKTDSTFSVFAINGAERLALDDATVQGDSVRIPMEIFDSEIVAQINEKSLVGRYSKRNPTQTTTLEFNAEHGAEYRFTDTSAATAANVSGKWAVTFSTDKDPYPAVGVFNQQNNQLTGTFLTPTGDYRYLAGNVVNDSLYLSCFDGNHVFLFKARIDSAGNRLTGGFWSGATGYEKWTGVRDSTAKLPSADSLTALKKGYDKLAFSFPDPSGKKISLSDPAFQNKVVIVQIMGTWCPNCMDETRFLAPWYAKNKSRGVEVIGLAYEKSPELAVSGPKIERMKQRFNVDYPVLLAGINDKQAASKTLPMLNQVLAFPTTIFVDKKGVVRRIHTGFSGPGTGQYYAEFVTDFTAFVDTLVAE